MNTTIQKLAGVFGVAFILLGVVGLFAQGAMAMTPTDPAMASKALGIFPVNLLHNVVHMAVGFWGLAAARSWNASKQFFTIGGAIYAVLTILGFVAPTGFNLVPLGGPDIWLHCVLAIVMLAIGYTAKPALTTTTA